MRRAAVVLAALVLAAPALASEERPTLSELEGEVMCPTCETTLDQSSSPIANRMRAFVRERIEAGDSKSEIKAALVDEFGDSVLALPSKDRFKLSAYVAPLLAMLLAGAAIVVALARWRRAGARGSPGVLDPADVMRLDEELRREEP